MAVAPTVQNSTQTDDDAASPTASPTTKVLAYLRTKGIPPSSANVRAALEANARDPGVIPGLRSDTAATEADDQAAMAAAGQGRGGKGGGRSVAGKIEGGGTPDTPPDRSPGTTSAPPETDTSWLLPSALAGGGAGLGYYLANRGNPGAEYVGNAQPGTGRIMDVDPTALPGNARPQLGASAGPMPDPGALPPPPTALAVPQPSPMTQALDEATAPRTGVPSVGDSVPPMPNIGPMPPPRPMGPTSPVLPADLGSPPPQTIPSGPNTQVRPANMPENAPRVPMPNRVGAAPTPTDFYHPSFRNVLGPLARAILGHGR